MIARNRIKIVLAEKDINHNILANEMGVTLATVSKWVNNKSQPRMQMLYNIAIYLGVSVRSLLVDNVT